MGKVCHLAHDQRGESDACPPLESHIVLSPQQAAGNSQIKLMQSIKKFVALLTPRERKTGAMVLMLVIGMALLEVVGVASVMPFLAILGNPQALDTNIVLKSLYTKAQHFGFHTADDFLVLLGIGAFVLIMISAAYRILTHYIMVHYVEMCRHRISTRLLETYLKQPYTFFLKRHSGDMSKIILSEVDQLINDVFHPIYNMIAYSLVLIAIITLLLLVNPWLALLAASLIGGLYTGVFFSLRSRLTHLGEKLVTTNKARFVAANEAFGGIKDIKLFGREQSYLSRFHTPSEQYAASLAGYRVFEQVPNYLAEAIIFGTMLLFTLVLLISSGGLSGGVLGQILPVLGLYAFAAYRLKPVVQNIYQGFARLRYGKAVIDNIYKDMHPNDVCLPLSDQQSTPLKAHHTIALRHLSYTYPGTAKAALIDLNFEIPVGSSLGLVGSTGAGKTTLIDVLLGLLEPTQGEIAVDGVTVTQERLRAWQQNLGYVPQEIFLTDSSIAENIALGILPEQIDQHQVEHCARLAQVHDFVMQDLPEQYATLVGERGVRLSGGQRQRIGIARALYHNPEILVFDEATSALDTITEQAVMEAIDALAHQKTIILIAHRLSTVQNCDQIILLDQGKIQATGQFDMLVTHNDQFRQLSNQGLKSTD